MASLTSCRPVQKPKNYQPLPDPFAAPNPGGHHEIIQVRDNLYRFVVDKGPGAHTALFLVTKDGIIVTDPVRTSAALWLKDELKKRFNQKVKYVIYSHGHFDHIGGSQVFQNDGAIVIAHENAVEPIIGEQLPTAIPDQVFSDRATLKLGEDEVQMTFVAPSHSNSMIIIHFVKQRAISAVDFCPIGFLPYNDFLDFYCDGWIKSLHWLSQQDFDILEAGHYELGSKKDVFVQIDYMENLYSEVMKHLRSGCPWDLIWRKVHFKPEHKKLGGFERMSVLNIVGMHRWCSNHRRGVW